MKRVPYKAQFEACEVSGCLNDNRFFVVNGYLFDMIDSGERFFVGVYDADDGAFNASHGAELALAYTPEYLIAVFEFETQDQAIDWVFDQMRQRMAHPNNHGKAFDKLLAFYPAEGV